MILWVSVFLVIVGGVLALSILPIRIHVEFSQRQQDTNGALDVRYLFGIVHMHKQLLGVQTTMSDEGPAVKATHTAPGKGSGSKHQHATLTAKEALHILVHWQEWVVLIREMWIPLQRFLHRVHIGQCNLDARVGTGDVVMTGVANGVLWGLISTLVGRMTTLCECEASPIISVQPDFQQIFFEIKFDCIAQVRAGHAMWAVIHLARVWRRRKTDGTSHSGAHENSHGEHS